MSVKSPLRGTVGRRLRLRLLPLTMAVGLVVLGLHVGRAADTLFLGSEAQAADTSAAKTSTKSPVRSEVQLATEAKKHAVANDDKARQLELRERLAEAAERRVDSKLAQLHSLEAQATQQETQKKQQSDQQFSSLVKLYESMKPADAARIFERLDPSVQLAVATRMREQKMASIMSAMNPDAAKQLTMEMAKLARSNGVAR